MYDSFGLFHREQAAGREESGFGREGGQLDYLEPKYIKLRHG
jgi:hypothetical protein